MASALIHKLIELGHKVAFVVDSEDLIRQTQRTLDMDVSIVKAGYEKEFDKDCPIQIIMLQTFFARKAKVSKLASVSAEQPVKAAKYFRPSSSVM